jgi:hypothetical protein
MNRSGSGRALASLIVCGALFWTACSTAWIAEAEQIVAVLMPGIANVLTLVSTLDGQSISSEDLQNVKNGGAQAEADLELLQSLISEWQNTSAANRGALLAQIQSEVTGVQANLNGLLGTLHIKDASSQAKVTAVVKVLLAEVQSIAAIMPATRGSRTTQEMTAIGISRPSQRVRLSANEFVKSYNATMTAKTGNAGLDRATKGLQIHLHSKIARWASVGILR